MLRPMGRSGEAGGVEKVRVALGVIGHCRAHWIPAFAGMTKSTIIARREQSE